MANDSGDLADEPEAQKEALRKYQNFGYASTNKFLREGRKTMESNLHVRALDKAIDKSKLNEDKVLHRGINIRDVPTPGSLLNDKAFQSFSEKPAVAQQASLGPAERVVLHAHVPKGHHALKVDENVVKGEHEYLLPRQQAWRVHSVEKKNDKKLGSYHVVHVSPEARAYGDGHDMTVHGEGKPHGE